MQRKTDSVSICHENMIIRFHKHVREIVRKKKNIKKNVMTRKTKKEREDKR